MENSAILYKVTPKSSSSDDVKVLLNDYSVTTVSRFNKETMNPIGVQIKNGVYMTLYDAEDSNGNKKFDLFEARKEAESEYLGGYIGFGCDWLEYMNHKQMIDDALIAVGGKKLCNEEHDDYWTSTGRGNYVQTVACGGTIMGFWGGAYNKTYARPFIAVDGE